MTNSTLVPPPPAPAAPSPLDRAGEAPEPPAPVHLPRRVRVEQAILNNPWVERIGREAFAASMGITRGPHKVMIERNIAAPMPDGVVLIADRYAPQDAGPRPVIIMRTPYNRAGGTLIGGIFPWYFASYGYNVLIQDVRGRFASGGEYAPFLHEAEDGAATVVWTLQQPWCDGAVGMWGASYLGYCQWSAAATAPPGSVKALAPLMTSAWLMRYPEHGFPLDLLARWMLQLATMTDPTLPLGERLRRINDAAVQDQLLAAAFNHLPLATADEAAIGHPSPHYRRMAEAKRDHPNWHATNFTDRVAQCPPGDFVSGWYDLFLDGLLDDFRTQQAAGLKPRLTVGPWHHLDLDYMPLSFRSALDWFDTHLRGAPTQGRRKAVRLFVMGINRWREFDAWPPRASSTQLYLQGSGAAKTGRLRLDRPAASAPDRYSYDPADPTPNLGGPKMGSDAGAVDNRALEARHDVLVFTTTPLSRDLEVIGPVYADLYVRSSTPYTDFFARLCVVDRHGRSLNVCDGNLRLEPGQGEPQPDGSLRIRVAMSATAYCFRAGQRIRLQVSSGAHPRFARNLGTGESLATGVRMVVAEQTLYHDAAHPSSLVLAVVRQGEGVRG